jgi:hypothetical protein
MARRIQAKNHNPQAFAFDGSPIILPFPSTTLAANSVRDTPVDQIGLPFACKIPLVGLAISLGGNNITAMNVAIGGGVLTAAGVILPDNSDMGFTPPQLNVTPGYCLFQGPGGPVDQVVNLSGAGNYLAATYPTSEPDAIFPGGTVMTLRLVIGASTAGFARATLLCIPVDIKPMYAGPWTWGSANIG